MYILCCYVAPYVCVMSTDAMHSKMVYTHKHWKRTTKLVFIKSLLDTWAGEYRHLFMGDKRDHDSHGPETLQDNSSAI